MIKIIKEGTRDIRECESCGCLFSFDKEDIVVTYRKTGYEKHVKCPQCSFKVNILLETKKEPLNFAGVQVPDDAWCNNCKHFDDDYENCNICVKQEYWEPQQIVQCPSCHGTGMTTPENKCGYCDGKGVIEND